MTRLRQITRFRPSLLILALASVALIAATYAGAQEGRELMARHEVEELADPIQREVQGRLDQSMQAANAAASLMETQPGTTGVEFARFVDTMLGDFTGVTRIGFARVQGDQLPVAFDGPIDSNGISPRAGDDLAGSRIGELARRASGGPAVSNLVVRDHDGGILRCFVAVYPVNDMAGEVTGYVYAEIDIDAVLAGVTGPELSADIERTTAADGFTAKRSVQAAQNVWTLRVTSTAAFEPQLAEWVPTIAASGVLAFVLGSGAVFGLIGAYRSDLRQIADQEQERRASLRLAELERVRLASIVEGHADGVVTMDERGMIRAANTAAEEMFGHEPGALLGKSVAVLMPESYRVQHAQGVRRVAAGGESKLAHQWLQLEGVTASGETFPLSLYIYPIDHDGARGFAGIIRRVDREAAPASRPAYGEDFVAHAAHEMKGSLFSLMLSLDMLQEQSGEHCSPTARRMLDMATGSAERLSSLLQGMMDLRRVREGHGELERRTEDLSALLFDALVDQQHAADARRVQFNINTSGDLHAEVDRRWVRQVFANLLSNAVKYSPDDGEVAVAVSGDSSSVTIRVCDRGPGIPEAFQPQMFQMFSRAAGQQISGNGIGLALTREIVELHGGTISFETAAGEGTNFKVRLPRRAAGALPA